MFEVELVELSKIEALRLIHLFVCAVAALFLIFIWRRAANVDSTSKKNIGLLLLAGAFLMWVFMDAYRFTGFMKPGESSLIIKTFSAYNNAFFIASLPFFEGSFSFFHNKVKIFKARTKWALVVLASNIVLVMVYSMAWKNEQDSGEVVNYIDLVYSILTYALLGYAITSRCYASKPLRKSIFVVGLFLSLALLLIQFSFSPLFTIVHYDLLSVSAMICHVVLAILLISLGYEELIELRTSLVSEQYRTDAKIKQCILKNQELQDKLDALQLEANIKQTLSALTDREMDVLRLIVHSYSEIGNKLFISRDTVITHKKNIEGKLGISGKKELEKFAISKGLIEPK